MAELDRLRARARVAAEVSLLRAALRPAPWLVAFTAIVAGLATEGRVLMALLAAGLGVAIVLLGWRRPLLGRAAWQGLVLGAPVSVAALLARGCAPRASDWACGAICVALGVAWATLATPAAVGSNGARFVTAVTAALAAFVGCSSLGVGVGVGVAAATATAWTVTSVLRPVTP